MRIAVVAVAAVLLGGSLAGSAAAQPGQTQPALPPPGQLAPPRQVPPPYMYQPPPPQLTPDERQLLEDGEITDGQYIGGGILAVFPGFGVGHAVQGRWSDNGWIFTVGEIAATGLVIYGISQDDCFLAIDECHDTNDDGAGEFVVGFLAYTGLRIWEIVDAWAAPPRHNRRVQNLRLRLGYPQQGYGTVGSVGFDF